MKREKIENPKCPEAVTKTKNILRFREDPIEIDGTLYEVFREADGSFSVLVGESGISGAMNYELLRQALTDEIKWNKLNIAVPVTIVQSHDIWQGTAYGLDSIDGYVLVQWPSHRRDAVPVHGWTWLRRLSVAQHGMLHGLLMEQKKVNEAQQRINGQIAKLKEECALDIVAEIRRYESEAGTKKPPLKLNPKPKKSRETKEK